jgi:hypothetical protein
VFRAVPAAAMLALVLTGCGEDDVIGTAGTPTSSASPTDPTNPTEPPGDDVTDQPEPVAQAIADLAAEAGVGTDAIALVSYVQVTWRDGSLGCPQPGMMYTQALVEGYRVTLSLNGEKVFYHGATGQAPLRCDNPAPGGTYTSNPDG